MKNCQTSSAQCVLPISFLLRSGDSEHFPGQLHEKVLKQAADEKRRGERKLRHLQDDLRYALKKLPEPLDVNLSYEEVRIYLRYPVVVSSSDHRVGRATL